MGKAVLRVNSHYQRYHQQCGIVVFARCIVFFANRHVMPDSLRKGPHRHGRALRISDATPELNSLMGFAYLAKGNDTLDAIDYLEAAADAAPHDQASRILLANAYLYVGNYGEAIDVAESVLLFEHQPNEITDAAHDVIDEASQRRAQ